MESLFYIWFTTWFVLQAKDDFSGWQIVLMLTFFYALGQWFEDTRKKTPKKEKTNDR